MKLVYSKHAKSRMLTRDVNDRDILRSIEYPKTRVLQLGGIIRITSDEVCKNLAVTYMPFKDGAFIITVFWKGEE